LKTEFGVQYTAWSNTMKAAKLTRDDLIEELGGYGVGDGPADGAAGAGVGRYETLA
jgi:hypothetical protein